MVLSWLISDGFSHGWLTWLRDLAGWHDGLRGCSTNSGHRSVRVDGPF
jgi:hypothetical protein